MPKSPRCWSASTVCHVEWRPSSLAFASLLILGGCAALALLCSDLPPGPACALAAVAAGRGAWLARRHRRLPRRRLTWQADAPVLLDGVPLADPRLHWRGPWVFLHWHETSGGRTRLRTLVWWPGTMEPALRRELWLLAGGHDASRMPPSVAT